MNDICRRVEEYMNAYKANVDRIHAMDEKIFQASVPEGKWLSIYNERSEAIRQAYAENVKNLQELKEIFALPMTAELADTMYQLIYNLDRAKYDDPFYSVEYLERLYQFYCEEHLYEGEDALEREIYVTQRLGYAYGMVARMGQGNHKRALDCYLKVISLRHLYSQIADANYRHYFFVSYYNAINNFITNRTLDLETTAQLIDEMDRFWKSKEVQELDGDNEQIRFRVLFTKQFWLAYTFDDNYYKHSPECINIYKRLADELWNEEKKQHGSEYIKYNAEAVLAHFHAAYLTGSVGFTDTVKEILRYYDLRHTFLQTQPKNTEFVYDSDYMFESNIPEILVSDWLTNDLLDETFRKEQTARLIKEKNKYITGLISRTESVLLNYILSSWDTVILSKLETKQEKEEILFNNIINRQIATYFHSQMVATIAELYVDAILRTAPELFIGIRDIADSDEVLRRQDELRKFARDCALIHDVGKNKLADIINTQSRKLTDEEFEALKKHCDLGADMMDSDFDEYKDVIRGHHKFYNDRGGYPEHFTTADSPVRVLINLITVCDCIDAATDYLGRNYSTGKTFTVVAQELRDGKGTRYNPELVELLDKDPYLFDNLNDILSNRRGMIYYRLNQVFITKQ